MTSAFASLPELVARRWLARSLAAYALLSPGVAQAEGALVELTWRAPMGCPTRDSVLSRLRELLGASAPNAPLVRADGEIEKRGDGFELRLVTEQDGRRGERLVRSAQCEDLRGVTAVALTLLLTSESRFDAPSTQEQTGSTTDPAPPAESKAPSSSDAASEPKAAEEPREPPAAPRAWRVLLPAPQLAVQLGPLPKASVGASFGVGIEGAWWSLRALGQWSPSQRVPAAIEGYGAEARRAALALWLCSEHHLGPFSLAPCLQLSAARLKASGYGPFLRPSSQTETTWGVGLGGIARARLTSWLALMVGVSGQLELSRPRFFIDTTQLLADSVGPERRLAPVSASLLLGPEWIF